MRLRIRDTQGTTNIWDLYLSSKVPAGAQELDPVTSPGLRD